MWKRRTSAWWVGIEFFTKYGYPFNMMRNISIADMAQIAPFLSGQAAMAGVRDGDEAWVKNLRALHQEQRLGYAWGVPDAVAFIRAMRDGGEVDDVVHPWDLENRQSQMGALEAMHQRQIVKHGVLPDSTPLIRAMRDGKGD